MRPRPAVALVLLLLLGPAVPTSHAQSQPGPDAPLLRLYGCSDDLDQTEDLPRVGLDGQLDCEGDHLRLPAAWLSGATDPGLRAALPTHDQRIDLTLVHHPTYWAPAPGTTGLPTTEIARPGLPDQGLFDVATAPTPGRLDLSLVSDEDVNPGLDANDQPDAVDLSPADGLLDRADRNDGRHPDADFYVPAIETRYDLTWWTDGTDPVPLPSGGNLLVPGVAPVAGLDSPDAWSPDQDPPRFQWYATPFGHGNGNDATGALVTPPLTLRPGDSARFFDHSLVLVEVTDADGRASAVVDVRYAGRAIPERIGHDLRLDIHPDQQTPATLASPGADARNVLFADTRQVSTTPPAPEGETSDDAWFVLLTHVQNDTARPQATVRLGRMVSTAAPLNTIIVDGSLYRVSALDERNSALHQFGWSRILPLGQDFRFRQLALDVPAVRPDGRIPFLPPFDRNHVHLQDMRPDVQRDPYGFLRERGGGNNVIGTGELALSPGSTTPHDRARRTDPLDVRWHTSGEEKRLTTITARADGTLQRALVAPFRYATISTDETVLVHSALLDDADLIIGATEARDSPRAARSFVASGSEPFIPYVDDTLRIYSGTRADPNAADVLHLGSAIIRPPERIGQTRLPNALAAQRVDLDVRFQAYHIYEPTGKGLRPISDESIDRALDTDADPHIIDATRDARGDNLYDVAPRNNDAQLGDIYGPVLHVRYTGQLVDPNTLQPLDTPFDANTRIFVPAADRDDGRAGLDSADLNGDGRDEGIVVADYWDRDAQSGTGNPWSTTGTFDATQDLVRLQSPIIEVPLGGDARFFDYGVAYVSYDGSARGTGVFRLLDLRESWRGDDLPVLAEAPNVGSSDARCLVVARDGGADPSTRSCASVQVADRVAPFAIRPEHDHWWVEVIDVGAASASVRVNRVLAPPSAESWMPIGGVLYSWPGWKPGAADGVAAWELEALVPVGPDVVLGPGDPLERLVGLPVGGRLPVLPPFDAPHVVLDGAAPDAARDVYGRELGEPRTSPVERLREVDALFVQTEERDQMRSHRFVHLDPVRWLDPTRGPGHAFVGGTFATPWAGIVQIRYWLDPAPHELKSRGPDGFDEVLQGAGDRGWDAYMALDLPRPNGPYLLDSARLGAPSRTVGPERADPWLEGRTSAFYLHDLADPADPYGGTAAGQVVPPGGTPPPTPVPPEAEPSDGGGNENEDGPAAGIIMSLLAVALALRLAPQRRRP